MLYAPHDLYLIRSARTLASHWARQNRAESTGLPSSRPMSVSGAELPRIRARYRITQLTPTALSCGSKLDLDWRRQKRPDRISGADCPGTVKSDHLWANALCARTQLAETVSSRVIRLALSERLR